MLSVWVACRGNIGIVTLSRLSRMQCAATSRELKTNGSLESELDMESVIRDRKFNVTCRDTMVFKTMHLSKWHYIVYMYYVRMILKRKHKERRKQECKKTKLCIYHMNIWRIQSKICIKACSWVERSNAAWSALLKGTTSRRTGRVLNSGLDLHRNPESCTLPLDQIASVYIKYRISMQWMEPKWALDTKFPSSSQNRYDKIEWIMTVLLCWYIKA